MVRIRCELGFVLVHHTNQHPEAERQGMVVKVRKVLGQLAAVERMLGEDKNCSEVLTQLVSARRGLKALAEKRLHSHMHHCIEGF